MDSTLVADLLADAARSGVFPGCALLVADDMRPVWRAAFGRVATWPVPGPPASVDTVYDVASVTKAAATALVVMRLIEAGRLSLDSPACAFVPELAGPGKERIRVRDLLCHASGLPAWRPLFERIGPGERERTPSARDRILRMAAGEPVEREPGTRSVYSDLGFMVLGLVVERAGGDRLDRLAERVVFEPLGMNETRFVDLDAAPRAVTPSQVAPTEACPRRGLVVGEVHDDNCHAAGGILGHAGLFSTVNDLSRLCHALAGAWQGERVPGGFPPEMVREFFSPCGIPGSTWRLGWDGPSPPPGASQAGDLWPKTGVGHLGFTGCSAWIDLERARWVILLSNRVHPSREDQRIKVVRPRVHDAIVRMLSVGG
ncbi:MAG: beta-lactamase family protein [Deltaproteobacteria bacterium]|nr:beta-lactamase family protein [Deltaproteobacteria bacterium]